MKLGYTGIVVVSAIAVLAAAMARAEAPPKATPAAAFVSPAFAVPTRVATPQFTLVPLGPALAQIDFTAYMASIEHLQTTFTRSTEWPHAGITAADAMGDMEAEQARFRARSSFAYAVLTPDGKRERGCIYVSPSPVAGYDAVVRIWVTKAEYDAGFDAALYKWAADWVKKSWRFKKVAYPGRAIDWRTWDGLVAAKPGGVSG
jgi:hypothetical protein